MTTWQTTEATGTVQYHDRRTGHRLIGEHGHTLTLTTEEQDFIDALAPGTTVRFHRRIEVLTPDNTPTPTSHTHRDSTTQWAPDWHNADATPTDD